MKTVLLSLIFSFQAHACGELSGDNWVVFGLSESSWSSVLKSGRYQPPSLKEEGFIHGSKPSQVHYVMNKYFSQDTYYLLLAQRENLGSKLIYESADNVHFYPHLYRELLVGEVDHNIKVTRNYDGTFSLPCELADRK